MDKRSMIRECAEPEEINSGRFSFTDIYQYLRKWSYPDISKADKSSLRRRSKFFCYKGADLFYTERSNPGNLDKCVVSSVALHDVMTSTRNCIYCIG